MEVAPECATQYVNRGPRKQYAPTDLEGELADFVAMPVQTPFHPGLHAQVLALLMPWKLSIHLLDRVQAVVPVALRRSVGRVQFVAANHPDGILRLRRVLP